MSPYIRPHLQTAEATAVAWHAIADIPKLMPPAYATRVLDALGEDVHIRAHDGTNLLPDVRTMARRGLT